MGRFFNTAGPVNADDHYTIPPLTRINLDDILSLIGQKKYFVLHAPRQTGKTSYLLALMEYLNKEGNYHCLYVNIEAGQAARGNVKEGIRSMLSAMAGNAIDYLDDSFLMDNWKEVLTQNGEFTALHEMLRLWCINSEKPVVLLIDEIDALVGDTLISLLRQLRSGYTKRPRFFPQSIILCGVRDVRDYRLQSESGGDIITGGSAFNVKAKSLRLGAFSPEDIKTLFSQHTNETGQEFEPGIFPLVWELTEGQPWLVNALGFEVCFEIDEGKDREKTITTELLHRAKENLIVNRETHLDQLADKLKEDRVRRVIEPLLAGTEASKIPPDDIDYVADLGLIRQKPSIHIANQIYREIIPRQLTYSTQLTIVQDSKWYTGDDGRLNMDKLLTAFQDFFRKHFESWIDGFEYREAGAQLLLQAFLQRVVNSGGRVEREYGFGRQRTDLAVIWPNKKGVQEVVIECKLRYGSLETTIKKGLEQTASYMDKCGTGEGYLLIFDRTPGMSWDEKIFRAEKSINDKSITVFGL